MNGTSLLRPIDPDKFVPVWHLTQYPNKMNCINAENDIGYKDKKIIGLQEAPRTRRRKNAKKSI